MASYKIPGRSLINQKIRWAKTEWQRDRKTVRQNDEMPKRQKEKKGG